MNCLDLNIFEDDDVIEPCRTCGIYFISNQAVIKPMFTKNAAGDDFKGNMFEIVQQMKSWNLQVNQDDGRPQYMCVACIGEFERMLQFKRSCVATQEQFDELDYRHAHNGVVIKQEIEERPQNKFCGFIYLDDDDEEGGSEEDGSRRVCAPFDIPHVPIKEEHTARIPQESQYKPPAALPLVSNLPEEATFAQVKPEQLAAANGFSADIFKTSPEPNQEQDSEDEIIKFTYDDEDDSEPLKALPMPIEEAGVYCKLCGNASATQDQHTEHMRRVHMLTDRECHICGKQFSNAHESRLRFHMKWHKLQKHLKCPICGFFCNSKDTLKEHKLAVHTRSKCEFCGKQMMHKQLQGHLNRHIQEHEDELARKLSSIQTADPLPTTNPTEMIQCAFCDSTFDDAERLGAHVLVAHRTPPKQQLETRAATSEEAETSASTIQDSFNSSPHSASTEPRPSKSMCSCHICGKSFDLKIKLNRHLKLHTKAPF